MYELKGDKTFMLSTDSVIHHFASAERELLWA